jgi:phage baseplate assembly protein W
MAKTIIYSDIDISFRAHPVTGNLIMRKDKKAIAQAVKNLVLLNKYEDLIDPNLYTNVTHSLFELIDDSDLIFLQQKIEATLRAYEPRAELVDVRYKNDLHLNGFTIDIIYIPQNSFDAETVDIFIERTR